MVYSDINPILGVGNKLKGYEIDEDEDAIKNSLRNIFLIQQGECPGKPNFGNPLDMSIFDLFSFQSRRQIEDAVISTIAKYEPRVSVNSVDVTLAPEYNRIIVNINFSYRVDDSIKYSDLQMPFSHNSVSYLGGRVRPPKTAERLASCHFEH